jgi:hypothetical protein
MSEETVTIESTDLAVVSDIPGTVVLAEPETIKIITNGAQGPPRAPATCRVETIDSAVAAVLNWSAFDEYRVTLSADFAPGFAGAADGQRLVLTIIQDGTGGRSVSLPDNVRYSTDLPSYSATGSAGRSDKLGFIFNATDQCYDLVAVIKGF